MAKRLRWKYCAGQQRIKDIFATAFEHNALGHAYLFSGAAGVGKFQTALELVLALHCLNNDEVPCYVCESCKQVLHYNHPDFHYVFPVVLEPLHKNSSDSTRLSEEGWRYITESAQKKISDPYSFCDTSMGHIPVEWVRELNAAILRGRVQSDYSVAVIEGIDMMHAASANAMLKTLEEPPAGTLIILLTEKLHAVLQTIKSRCQIIRFGNLTTEEIASALSRQYSKGIDDPALRRAAYSADGSLGKAKTLIEESSGVYTEQAQKLWDLCVTATSWTQISSTLETLCSDHLNGGKNFTACEKLLRALQQLIRAAFFQTITGSGKYFDEIQLCPADPPACNAHHIHTIAMECEEAIAAVNARGNIMLVLTTLTMSLTEILHGKKQ